MKWTTPASIKKQLERLWSNGILPNAIITENNLFPLTLPLRAPRVSDITNNLHNVREWTETLKAMPYVRLIWNTVNNRVQGKQTLPYKIVIESLNDALHLLNRKNSAKTILNLYAQTQSQAPFLLPWLCQRALTALPYAEKWDKLLALCLWIREHPKPDIYLRQVDLPGIHTKFIENNKAILARLFEYTLPHDAINLNYKKLKQFDARYGFRSKPLLLRFRVLDSKLSPLIGCPYPDITLDAESFSTLALSGCRIFIVENESCFLAFPPLNNALVIFGAGYGWDTLKPSVWLKNCPIYYWGDIDTHGFRILSYLRAILAHTKSFLMNEEIFLAYRLFWDTEPSPVRTPQPRLTFSEQNIFTSLQNNFFGYSLRLEQERIHFSDLQNFLKDF